MLQYGSAQNYSVRCVAQMSVCDVSPHPAIYQRCFSFINHISDPSFYTLTMITLHSWRLVTTSNCTLLPHTENQCCSSTISRISSNNMTQRVAKMSAHIFMQQMCNHCHTFETIFIRLRTSISYIQKIFNVWQIILVQTFNTKTKNCYKRCPPNNSWHAA